MPNLNLGDAVKDLGNVTQNSDFTLTPTEHPDDRAVRLAGEKRTKLLDDIRGMALFCVVLVSILIVGGFCAYTIFLDAAATPETQKYAQTALTALLSGGFSFLIGRAMGSAKR